MLKYIKSFFIVVTAFCLAVNTVSAGTFKADAKTKRIPAGTTFTLEFLQPISTYSGGIGDSFIATLKNDQSVGTNVILPSGTIVRGSIQEIKTAKRLSRGAKLYLDFDHVVTPTGRQIPLEMAVCNFENIYYDGGLYKNLGYGEAVRKNYEKSTDIVQRSIQYGLDAGDATPGIEYILTPCCAVGGFIGGLGYFAGQSLLDVFRYGKDVYINAGDVLTVKLLNPVDIPVY